MTPAALHLLLATFWGAILVVRVLLLAGDRGSPGSTQRSRWTHEEWAYPTVKGP